VTENITSHSHVTVIIGSSTSSSDNGSAISVAAFQFLFKLQFQAAYRQFGNKTLQHFSNVAGNNVSYL